MSGAARAAGTALAAALALSACSGSPARSSAPTSVTPTYATGVLRQFRADRVKRLVEVTVTPREALSVRAVRLRTGGFTDLPATTVSVDLPAGGTVDLSVPYGTALCDQQPGAASATLTVLPAGGGPAQERELPLPDGGLLGRLHQDDCADAALRQQVDLTAGTSWTRVQRDGRPALRGSLHLARRAPGHRVVLSELGANILFAVRSDTDRVPLLVLGPDDQAADLPVVLESSRCDPHALTESKRTSLINVYVGLDDVSPRLTTVVPDDASRATIEAFAVSGCGDAPAS